METRVATILSFVLHPLLLPTYAVIILLNLPLYLSFTLTAESKLWLIALVAAFTFIMPVAIILSLYYFRIIDSLELENPSQRTIPLIFSSVSYLALVYLLRKSGLPDYLLYLIYGALFVMVTGLLVNLFYKISLHMLGWGAIVAAFAGLSVRMGLNLLPLIVSCILLAGIAGFARLKLNAHNPSQVYLGFVAGVSVVLVITFAL